jgi:AraC family transcriptional regulator, transcriptional activator of pobA
MSNMAPARPLPHDDLGGAGASIFVARHTGGTHRPARARTAVTHQYAAVAFQTAGRSVMEQRGRWTLEAGDVFLVPAGEPHRRLDAHRPERWGLGFCVPCFAADDAGSLLEPFERVRAGAAAVVRIPSERQSFLDNLFRELQAASDPRGRAQPHAVQRSLLTLILNEVRRAAGWDAQARSPKSVVADSLAFIERNCLRPLRLKDVASAVGRSPAYVTTALTRATGKSAVAWIIAGRMAEARRLLLHSDEMIDVVAERVGYADPTHFIRMFQRAHGTTPAAWRTAKSGSR